MVSRLSSDKLIATIHDIGAVTPTPPGTHLRGNTEFSRNAMDFDIPKLHLKNSPVVKRSGRSSDYLERTYLMGDMLEKSYGPNSKLTVVKSISANGVYENVHTLIYDGKEYKGCVHELINHKNNSILFKLELLPKWVKDKNILRMFKFYKIR